MMTLESGWVAVAIGLGVGAMLVLVRTIRSLIQRIRAATVARLPLVTSQSVELPEAGAYELWAEGRRLTGDFRALDFALSDASGQAVPLSRTLLPTSSEGLRLVRMKLRSFLLSRGGSFTLSMTGLSPEPDADSRIILSRSLAGVILVHVLAIVASSVALLGLVVATALVLAGAI